MVALPVGESSRRLLHRRKELQSAQHTSAPHLAKLCNVEKTSVKKCTTFGKPNTKWQPVAKTKEKVAGCWKKIADCCKKNLT